MARGGHNRIDLTGKRYGRLFVLEYSHTVGKVAYWKCKCDCGAEKVANGGSLRSGGTESCGCIKKERMAARNYKHGLKKRGEKVSAPYQVWNSMMSRCYCKTSDSYPDYGARGITVCQDWHDASIFVDWYLDNKPVQGKFTLDRYPDLNGPYSPNNCRFATDAEQVRNRRMTVWVEINGEKLCLKDAVEKYGVVSYSRAKARVREMGWTPLDAIMTPDRRRLK